MMQKTTILQTKDLQTLETHAVMPAMWSLSSGFRKQSPLGCSYASGFRLYIPEISLNYYTTSEMKVGVILRGTNSLPQILGLWQLPGPRMNFSDTLRPWFKSSVCPCGWLGSLVWVRPDKSQKYPKIASLFQSCASSLGSELSIFQELRHIHIPPDFSRQWPYDLLVCRLEFISTGLSTFTMDAFWNRPMVQPKCFCCF